MLGNYLAFPQQALEHTEFTDVSNLPFSCPGLAPLNTLRRLSVPSKRKPYPQKWSSHSLIWIRHMLDCINIVMPHSYKNNKYGELCCLPRRQSWCQAAPGRLPGRSWTWLQKQSFLDLASENGEKGFCEWRRFSHRLHMKGRQMQRKAECCTDLTAWGATGENPMTFW